MMLDWKPLAFVVWVVGIVAVALWGQSAIAPAALAILGACGGMIAFGQRK